MIDLAAPQFCVAPAEIILVNTPNCNR